MLSEVHNKKTHQQNFIEAPDRGLELWFAVLFLALLAFLLAFPYCQIIELWDESRSLNNAFEMALRGHWMVPTYNWLPDHWNTKPPLLIWAIAFLMRLHLPPMFALRLPSGLAALATLLVVLFFCRDVLGRPIAGILSALVLTSANLFWSPHMALAGDPDALLCLWSAIYCFGFWTYVEDAQGFGTAGLLASGAALALAILTKGIAGVLLLPGLFIYLLLSGRVRRVISDWKFWAALLASFAIAASYYLLRERLDPGYIQSVWANELGGRFGKGNEGHVQGPFFYPYRLLLTFEPGVLLIPLGAIALFKKPQARSVLLMCSITAVVLLLVLTKSATKINYYSAPVLPLVSVFSGIGLYETLCWISSKRPAWTMRTLQRLAAGALTIATVLVVARLASMSIERKNQKQAIDQYGDSYALLLSDMARQGVTGNVFILDHGVKNGAAFPFYNPVPEFYAQYETVHSRMSVSVHAPTASLPRDAWVLSCDPKAIALFAAGGVTGYQQGPVGCVYGKTASR